MSGASKLTAFDVLELMNDHSSERPSASDPYVYVVEYDWQAIADELNTMLDEARHVETCLNIAPYTSDCMKFACDRCGYMYNPGGVFGCDRGYAVDFAYCPCCGRKVVEG